MHFIACVRLWSALEGRLTRTGLSKNEKLVLRNQTLTAFISKEMKNVVSRNPTSNLTQF
jgi:hypothetical protein